APAAEGGAVAAPPCAMVIFGAAGDLTKRLLVPALYDLVRARRLPDAFRLVGIATTEQTTADWRRDLTEMMSQFVTKGGGEFSADHLDQAAWDWLTARMTYFPGDLIDRETYRRLGKQLAELDEKAGTAGNYLFYLAIPDRLFGTTVANLGAAGLVGEGGGRWPRGAVGEAFRHGPESPRGAHAPAPH